MPGVANIGTNAMDLRKSTLLQPYSKVTIIVDEETEFVAGNDSGLNLELECPWGTQQMAENILQSVRGYQYQPYDATTAIVDPAVELGDAIAINGVYGGIYQQDITFGHTYYSDFSAPQDEQLDHEYTYETPTERRITRQKKWARAEFRITNEAISLEVENRVAQGEEFKARFEVNEREINARVTQTGGNSSSFGWSLVPNAFTLYSGSRAVFVCNSSGIQVDGKITARSGYIGNGSSGFEIGNTFIRNGMTSYDDGSHNGIYLGTNGIALGAGRFKVNSSGNLYASSAEIEGTIRAHSGYFDGTVYVENLSIANRGGGYSYITEGYLGSGAVTESKISGGAVTEGKIGGGAVSGGKIQGGAVSKGKTSSGVQTSLSNADTALASINSLTAGTLSASYIKTDKLWVGAGGINMDNTRMGKMSILIGEKSYYVIGKSI